MKVIDRRMGVAAPTDATVIADSESAAFGQRMDQKRAEGGAKERLRVLLEQIDKQAQRLSERLDIGELKRYRSLVTEFVDLSVKTFSKYHKEHTLDGKGRHRIFGLVRKVDMELENLTSEVVKAQKDNIGVLAKLDDIRGLLLDIIA